MEGRRPWLRNQRMLRQPKHTLPVYMEGPRRSVGTLPSTHYSTRDASPPEFERQQQKEQQQIDSVHRSQHGQKSDYSRSPPPLTPSFPPGSLSRSDARKLDAKQVRQRSLSLQDRGGEQDAHTFVHEVKRPCDRQRAHTREDLSRVGLRPWDAAEAAVEVATPGGGAYGVREDVKRKDGEGEGRGGKGTTVHACLDLSACQHKCRGGRGRCRCRCRL